MAYFVDSSSDYSDIEAESTWSSDEEIRPAGSKK